MPWINFLHFYQPPTQDRKVVEGINKESYEHIADILNNNSQWRFTLNITGCLLEQLEEYGCSAFIRSVKKALEEGRIELVGSAKYHAILPLLPEKEALRQIRENEKTLKRYFGEAYKPRGFFFPEMAYGQNIARLIEKEGFEWVILGEPAYPGKVDWKKRYKIKGTDLTAVFNDRNISKTYVPRTVLEMEAEDIIFTATDGELYGHHHKDKEGSLEKAVKEVRTMTISEMIDGLSDIEEVEPRPSSWESTEEELAAGIPYALWADPENPIHKKLWVLTREIIKAVEKNVNDNNYEWARRHLDRALASCTFWWCSKKKPSPFCPVTWNPDEVEKGLNELIKAVRSLDSLSKEKKIKFEKKYFNIKKMVWEEHWK